MIVKIGKTRITLRMKLVGGIRNQNTDKSKQKIQKIRNSRQIQTFNENAIILDKSRALGTLYKFHENEYEYDYEGSKK